MIRRWRDLARVGILLVLALVFALTLARLVPSAFSRTRERWRAGRASLKATELDARRAAFGRPYADAIEAIRATLPEHDSYLLVSDGMEIVFMTAYDLAPRRPMFLSTGMPTIARVREAVRGRRTPLPAWTVVMKRGVAAPRLVATESILGTPSP
ncbi:MAG: hypothetical protein ABIT01_03950 [Thermoanaerobaculia bacterium]